MTIRELGYNISNWFADGWCKLILTESESTCMDVYYSSGVNWLDFTIGQAAFTAVAIFFGLTILSALVDGLQGY